MIDNRESLEVPRNVQEEEHPRDNHGTECDIEADRSASCCKSMALIVSPLSIIESNIQKITSLLLLSH